MNDHKPKDKPFKLYHAWNILKDFPKWQELHQSPTARSTQPVEDYTMNLDDDENDENDTVSPTPRKLELIEEQVALEKRNAKREIEKKEERVMAMDLSKYTPRKKKFWSDKQDKILDIHAAQAVPSNLEDNFDDDFYPSPPRYN